MKSYVPLCLFILIFTIPSFGQQENSGPPNLKQYYFVMLTAGPHRDQTDSLELEKIQAGHMANIHKMADEGKLQVAGPFGDDGSWRGIFIFDCKSEEEVKDLLKNDPAISSGRLAYEIHPWWTEKGSCLK